MNAIQVHVHHPYLTLPPRQWAYTSHYTGFKGNHSSFPPSLCLVKVVLQYKHALSINDNSNLLINDNYNDWLYFLLLIIPFLNTDNCTLFFNCISNHQQFWPLMDICISNYWQLYFLPWTLTISLSLTDVLLTTDNSITDDCTSQLTFLSTDNCISYHQQLYFLQLTTVAPTITSCNSYPQATSFLYTDSSDYWYVYY